LRELRKYEVWEDYWCYEPINKIPFELLKELNYYCWGPKEDDEIKIRIESYDTTELPKENQLKALEFIVKNEANILEGLWDYYQNLILPVYQTATDIEMAEIANNKSELSKVFGVMAIEIPPLESFSSVYFLIEFDFKYDCEHGLYLLFKNHKPIDLFGEGDKAYESIDIYEKGLYNDDQTPLKIRICKPDGNTVITGEYFYNKKIYSPLIAGAYRIFYTLNNSQRVRNFVVDENLENFTLEYVLKNCEKTTHNKP